jgi:hypothetical protein
MTTGWQLDWKQRAELLTLFPPAWPDVVADHVTLQWCEGPDASPLPSPVEGAIVGIVDDGAGLQALVVSINGTVDRPDGSVFHITWSLDRALGREEVDSNDVLARVRWRTISPSIPLRLIPCYV